MKKRILAMLLALLMCASLLPFGALASEEPEDPAPTEETLAAGEEEPAEEPEQEIEETEPEEKSVEEAVRSDGAADVVDEGECGDNLHYILYSDGQLEITGSGDMTDIPAQRNRKKVKKVLLPDGLTSICDSAFRHCVNLEEIQIPDTVKSVGKYAFSDTFLTSLTLPKSLESIGGSFLAQSKWVSKLTIPKNVTFMGDDGTASGGA